MAMGDRMAELWSCDKLLDIVEQVIGPDIEGYPIWNVRSKVPNNALMTVPWHQDNAVLAVRRRRDGDAVSLDTLHRRDPWKTDACRLSRVPIRRVGVCRTISRTE